MVDWSMVVGNSWDFSIDEIIKLHNKVHAEYGDADKIPDDVIEAEQFLSRTMRSRGFEHRHQDKLAKKAATYRENPFPFTLSELWFYLQDLTIESHAVQFVQTEKNGRIYAIFKGVDGKEDIILRAINRTLPPGVQKIARLNGTAKSDFLYMHNGFSLKLTDPDNRWVEVVTTWEAVTVLVQKSAADASLVFKSDIALPFTIVKTDHPIEEKIVTSVILEPEVPDNTKTKETQGDVYSEEEICKGMYWWMENAGHSFAYQHTMPETREPLPWAPGAPLTDKDIRLLENWQTRVDQTIGEQFIHKGTWMATARILNDDLWKEIKEGRITGWSVGMQASGKVETYEVVEGH